MIPRGSRRAFWLKMPSSDVDRIWLQSQCLSTFDAQRVIFININWHWTLCTCDHTELFFLCLWIYEFLNKSSELDTRTSLIVPYSQGPFKFGGALFKCNLLTVQALGPGDLSFAYWSGGIQPLDVSALGDSNRWHYSIRKDSRIPMPSQHKS